MFIIFQIENKYKMYVKYTFTLISVFICVKIWDSDLFRICDNLKSGSEFTIDPLATITYNHCLNAQ